MKYQRFAESEILNDFNNAGALILQSESHYDEPSLRLLHQLRSVLTAVGALSFFCVVVWKRKASWRYGLLAATLLFLPVYAVGKKLSYDGEYYKIGRVVVREHMGPRAWTHGVLPFKEGKYSMEYVDPHTSIFRGGSKSTGYSSPVKIVIAHKNLLTQHPPSN